MASSKGGSWLGVGPYGVQDSAARCYCIEGAEGAGCREGLRGAIAEIEHV